MGGSEASRRHGGTFAALAWAALLAASCGDGPPAPAQLDPAHDPCAWCRMTVSSPEFAAQVVAPGEEPLFFDDLGCLRAWMASPGEPRPGAVAYVADHRTRAWVPATAAVYTRALGLFTPMGSHLVAHADAASRDADPAAAGGEILSAEEMFGPDGLSAGDR